jgi:hypothetical protein
MTADLMPDLKTTEKKPNRGQENDGYMCITLELSIPCFKMANYDIANIDDDGLDRLNLELEESKELAFAQRLTRLTGLSILENIPGAKVFYTPLVKCSETEELELDGDSSG